jgi:hypothetical protein
MSDVVLREGVDCKSSLILFLVKGKAVSYSMSHFDFREREGCKLQHVSFCV